MLENIGIRTKVLSVVVVTAAIGTIAAASLSTVGTTTAVARATESVPGLRPLTDALRRERDASLGALATPDDPAAETALAGARILTSTLLSTTAASLDEVDAAQLPAPARAALERARDQDAAVARLRDGVDGGTLPAVSVRTGYDEVTRGIDALPAAVGRNQDDGELSRALVTWSQGQEVIARTAQQRDLIADAVASDGLDQSEVEALYATAVRRDTLRAAYAQQTSLSGVEVPRTAPELRGVRDGLLAAAVRTGPDGGPATAGFDPAAVSAATSQELSLLSSSENDLATAARARADALEESARASAITRVSVATALAGLLVLLGLLVANSIVRRLRRVTAATAALREELPAAVAAAAASPSSPPRSGPVPSPQEQTRVSGPRGLPAVSSVGAAAGRYGRDEVGRLATALDEVGALALDLAAGQARLRASVSGAFVSVARRNQSLLDRQLAAIDVLERDETEAAALEKLFELDHTTARMRRNAESLLVIAGVEGGRRSRETMSLVDVVRTAASGVEHYERVEVTLDADPQVLPHAALSLAHLVAELLENATGFSGPGAAVAVTSHAGAGAVVLTVADRGVGMGRADLERARERLAATADASTVDASRLGLTVVARLARRLGVEVDLTSRDAGEDRGTTATVVVPAALLAAGTLPAPAASTGGSAVGRAGDGGTVDAAPEEGARGADTVPDDARELVGTGAAGAPGGPQGRSRVVATAGTVVPDHAAGPTAGPAPASTVEQDDAGAGADRDPREVVAGADAEHAGDAVAGRARHRMERRRRWFARARHANDGARDDAAREVLEAMAWLPTSTAPGGPDGSDGSAVGAATTAGGTAGTERRSGPDDRSGDARDGGRSPRVAAVRADAPVGSGGSAQDGAATPAPWASRVQSTSTSVPAAPAPWAPAAAYEPVRRASGASGLPPRRPTAPSDAAASQPSASSPAAGALGADRAAAGSALPRRTAGERYRGATSGQMLTPPPRAPRADAPDRGPEQVRSTLAGFRAGVARARSEGERAPVAAPEGTGRDGGGPGARDPEGEGAAGQGDGQVEQRSPEPARAGRR